ncbi:MAG TPA: radical SAM protein [Labilithrix sp.]|nr:radical SAM protein [Labilithrix sp.]
MASRFLFNEVVVQPTSLCNLNCSYCYVPFRDEDRRMQPAVMERLAESLAALPRHDAPIYVLWHSGEPLAVGVKHMESLFAPLRALREQGKIAHRIQTNATLIDERWCDFFVEHNCELAVSLDGPPAANARRVSWSGAPSFDKTIRGIERLKAIGCEVALLAVVTEDQLDQAASLYRFFADLGCVRLGINLEERVGINLTRKMITSDRVSAFWAELHAAWVANPVIEIRELRLFADWWDATGGKAPPPEEQPTYRSNYLPTVGYDGNVVFLSTELLQCHAGKYEKFEIGNILTESLDDLVKKAKKANYVLDFLAGVDACKASCPHYSFCGGGFATNKFFELGTMAGTETLACRNSRKRLFEVLNQIRREAHA